MKGHIEGSLFTEVQISTFLDVGKKMKKYRWKLFPILKSFGVSEGWKEK